MRKGFLISAAAAPLLLSAAAHAQTVIEGDRNTPVRTSTANDGQPDDVEITGNVEVEDGTAVTVDSDNTLSLSGAILIEDADGAVGVLLQGGNTGEVTISGDISITENYTPENPDGDSDNDGPTAVGSNRTGILVEGPEPFHGDINLNNASIRVAGNDSYGIHIASGLDGDAALNSQIATIGTNAVGLAIDGPVSGDVTLSGSIRSVGENAGAVDIGGDIGGGLTLNGGVSATGFRNTSAFGQALADLDEDDLLISAPAMILSADVADAFFITGNGSIQSQGPATALLITANGASDDVTLGGYQGVDADDDGEIDDDTGLGFGFINAGQIAGDGIYEGYKAIGLQLEGGDTLQVIVEGGLYNINRIQAEASEATADALLIGGNVIAPEIYNGGSNGLIYASSITENGGVARAISIGAGSQVNALTNGAGILAQVVGEDGTAIAVMDESGTLTEVTNTNYIIAQYTPNTGDTDDTTVPPGAINTVALDLSNATEDTLITQLEQTPPLDENGEPDENFVAPTPQIQGDIKLGSGDDLVDIQAGTVNGDIMFGDGQDQLNINGGARVMGSLEDADGSLVIQVGDGVLQLENPNVVRIQDANFGSESELRILLSENSVTQLEAQGVIHFEDGAAIAASLSSLVGEGGAFEIITAGDLQVDSSLEQLAQTETPYLYNSSLEYSATNPNSLVLTLTRKTAQELGLNANEANAYDAAFSALTAADAYNSVFAGITNQADFQNAYEQLLPDFTSAALQFVLNNVDGSTGAVGNRLDIARLSREQAQTGVWAQEFGYFSDRETSNVGGGFRGHGFGFAAGVDRPWGPFYAAGLNLAISTSSIDQINGFDEPLDVQSLGAGVYAGGAQGNLTYDFYAGAGVDMFESERHIIVGVIDQRAKADWTGYHYSGSARVGYDMDLGWAMLRPLISFDYLSLSEGSYEETGLSGLNLAVDSRTSDILSGTASLALARRFGDDDGWWAPQLKIGVRNEFAGSLAATDATFVNVNDSFLLAAPELPSTSAIIGFLLTGGSKYSSFGFNYDADIRDGYIRHSARIVVRLSF